MKRIDAIDGMRPAEDGCSVPGLIPGQEHPVGKRPGLHQVQVHPVVQGREERRAVLHTNHGDITVDLFPDHAPKTVANFADLAEGRREWTHPATRQKTTDKLYDGTVFHRVISGFMIQGGDPLGQGIGGPGYQFGDEIHPDLSFNRPYLLAMANAGPGTNGSQFFITVGPTPHLNRKHTIFGEVADDASRQVVDKIATVKTARGDRPVEDVVIESVEVQRS
jgi:peptidyl-prolyl cis-trans isomerase A (cyclophilin A)